MKWAVIAVPAFVVAAAALGGPAQALPAGPGAAALRGTFAAAPSPSLLPARYDRYWHDRRDRYRGEPADADAGAIKPGEWQFSAQLQTQAPQQQPATTQLLPGAAAPPGTASPSGALKTTYTNCIASDKAVPSAVGSGCTLDSALRNGGRITWSMTCTNRQNAVRSDGVAQYRGDTMEGTMISHLPVAPGAPGAKDGSDGRVADLLQHITGRYLGPCRSLAQAPETPQTPIIPPRGSALPNAASGSSTQWVEPPAGSEKAAPSAATAAAPPSSNAAARPPSAAATPPIATAAVPPASTPAAQSVAPAAAGPSASTAAAPEQHYSRYASHRRYYRRHYQYYSTGPPNILALPFAAVGSLFGR
jgi:hypothetical protein